MTYDEAVKIPERKACPRAWRRLSKPDLKQVGLLFLLFAIGALISFGLRLCDPALRRILRYGLVRLRVGLVDVKQETHAAVGLVAKIALLKMQIAEFGSAVATLSDGRTSTRVAIRVFYTPNHHNLAIAHSFSHRYTTLINPPFLSPLR
jgi:hypothetical protein